MDPNANPTMAIDAIDSSVSSLASSFVQLNMNPDIGGPINRLPNEIMQMIVAKLGLDGDANKLVRLRLVSTRWRMLVEDYCGQKKSLFVVSCREKYDIAVFDIAAHKKHVKNKFFGFGNSKDFAHLVLIPKLSSQCLSSLLKIFSNIVQLSIRCSERTQATYFSVYITSLDSLKQLDLDGPFLPDLFSQSATLSKLEHFSIYPKFSSNSIQLVTQLGPNCVRFKFYFDHDYDRDYGDLFKRHINRFWLANVTHLAIRFWREKEHAQILPYLCEHATSLKHLSLKVVDLVSGPLKLSLAVIGNLAKLTHLDELKLWYIEFDVFELEVAAAERRLTPLSSVLAFKFHAHLDLYGIITKLTPVEITRGLSIIFPNLTDFGLTLFTFYDDSPEHEQFRHEVEQHLNRFPNLRKHKIVKS